MKLLREFYPHNSSLLGMNVNFGTSVMIRLRKPGNHKLFLPWYDLVGTLCHELTHNKISEHNDKFFALMNEVYDEMEKLPQYGEIYDEMMSATGHSKGYQVYNRNNSNSSSAVSTESFSGSGHKLGTAGSSSIISNGVIIKNAVNEKGNLSLKEKMAQAALARAGLQNNSSSSSSSYSGGHKLGLDLPGPIDGYRALTPKERREQVLESVRNRIMSSPRGESDSCRCNNSSGNSNLNNINIGGGGNSNCNTSAKPPPSSELFCKPVQTSKVPRTSNSSNTVSVIDIDDDDDEDFKLKNEFAGADDDDEWICLICLDSNENSDTCSSCGCARGTTLDRLECDDKVSDSFENSLRSSPDFFSSNSNLIDLSDELTPQPESSKAKEPIIINLDD